MSMKKAIKWIILLLILFLSLFSFSWRELDYEKVELKLPNEETLIVYIADTDEKRISGLSVFDSIESNEGMLFVFKEEIIPEFWMKNMKFGIDIVWLDEDLNIVGIEKNIDPKTYPETFCPDEEIKLVLEVNAGIARANNLREGDRLELLHY